MNTRKIRILLFAAILSILAVNISAFAAPAVKSTDTPVKPAVNVASLSMKTNFDLDAVNLFKIDINYPQISQIQEPAVLNNINEHYLNEALKFNSEVSNDFLKAAVADYSYVKQNGLPFYPYEAIMKFTAVMNEGSVLSTYTDKYEYLGGAHGFTVRSSNSWNLRTGHRILLKDLFKNKDYRSKVLQQILLLADSQYKTAPMYFDNYRESIKKYFDPDHFYLTAKGISLYYQLYEIAPYAAGIIVFEIPYEKLGIDRASCKALL